MSGQYLGEIRTYGFTFEMKDWAYCNGQIMSIQQNSALFSLLQTQFGGDGQRTFAFPDLRGRAPVHPDGGTTISQGNAVGTEVVTLTNKEMPEHTHEVMASPSAGSINKDTTPDILAQAVTYGDQTPVSLYARSANVAPLAAGTVSTAGGGVSHDNMQPYLVINFCIALQGYYPPRS